MPSKSIQDAQIRLLELMVQTAENKHQEQLESLNQQYEKHCPPLKDESKKSSLMDDCRNYCLYSINELFNDEQKQRALAKAKQIYEQLSQQNL